MKRIFTLLIILFLLCVKGFTQACTILGCASNAATFGTQTGNPLQVDNTSGILQGCKGGSIPFKQVFWEFFYSPTGGNLVQSFTTVGTTNGLDLDWAIWDMNMVPDPNTLTCPADPNVTLDPSVTGFDWVQKVCNAEATPDFTTGTGPGVGPSHDGLGGPEPPFTTVAGHYYAVGIILSAEGIGPDYTFNVGPATLNGAAMTVANCLNVVLPLKLSSFGARVNNCNVNLNWVSESETDFKNYKIESSTDGQNFKAIATISPLQNNTSSMQQYSYQDKSPQQGKVYYRLKMINIDGSFTYSNTIVMNVDCNKSSVVVYPNPVSDMLNVNITNSDDNATTANLFDPDGRMVYTKKLISGTNVIDMKKFPKGLYLLDLINKGETQHFKIIK